MLYWYKHTPGGIILRCLIRNATTPKDGLTGLSFASSGLIIAAIADVEPTSTNYTVAASNIETITTLGTFQTPTSGKCRFKEVDATNHPGLCEVHLATTRLSVTDATYLIVTLSGATNMPVTSFGIRLSLLDPQTVMRGTDGANTTTPPAASANATAVRSELAAELALIDVGIGTRMATFTALPPDSVNADALASDALNLIQAGLATSTALAGVQTDVDAIQAQTTATALRTAVGLDVANMDDQFDEVLAAILGISGGSGVTGANTLTVTVADADTDAVIQGARVRIYRTGEDGTTATNASGVAVLGRDSATWNVTVAAAGYETLATTRVVSGNASIAYELTPLIVASSAAPLCSVTIAVKDQYGSTLEGEPVEIVFLRWDTGADPTPLVLSPPPPLATNEDGEIIVDLLREAVYRITYGTAPYTRRIEATIPDAGSYTVETT